MIRIGQDSKLQKTHPVHLIIDGTRVHEMGLV